MKREILFISDLHLAWDKPEITRRFLHFLDTRAQQASELYILGDLFDAWVGDDDYSPPTRQVRQVLQNVTSSGVRVYLQHGNRDFLIQSRFCQETGVQLLPDHHVLEVFGVPTLLMHGDLLCTDDVPYQAFREKSRSEDWQRKVLGKALWLRLLAGRWYRLRSFFHKRKKSQDIMDVNPKTVDDTLRSYGCFRLIHGHTHRPDLHEWQLDGQPAQRFVLAAWSKDQGQCLSWSSSGHLLEVI